MKYFRIRQEDRDGQNCLIRGLITLPCAEDLRRGEIRGLPLSSSHYITSSFDVLPEILCKQIFMVSQGLFDLVTLYLGETEYRNFFLEDDQGRQAFYYIPQLPLMYCLSEQSRSNPDKSRIERTIIKAGRDYPDIFQISGIRDRAYILSLPFAESLLRRGAGGFFLEEAAVEEKPDTEKNLHMGGREL